MGFTRTIVAVVLAALTLGMLVGLTHPHAVGEERDYVFVWIRTGPATDLTPEQQQEAFAGHFANMGRMAEAGDLLIAGPLGPPMANPLDRGIFVFDAETLSAGMRLANTDPTTKAGVFELTGYVFSTAAPLTELTRLDREAEEARLADPDIPDEWEGRLYLLATAPYSDGLFDKVNGLEGVPIAGRLRGSGPDGSDRILVWVEATKPEDAVFMPQGEWEWSGWYGSKEVMKMGQ